MNSKEITADRSSACVHVDERWQHDITHGWELSIYTHYYCMKNPEIWYYDNRQKHLFSGVTCSHFSMTSDECN